jgi:hypothetical protein
MLGDMREALGFVPVHGRANQPIKASFSRQVGQCDDHETK